MTSNQEDLTLLVLAAGMGSRYGGLKQVDPVGPNGETLMDYSLHDAWLAGFSRVVFLIRPEMIDQFKEKVGSKYSGKLKVDYAFQRKDDLPASCPSLSTREKPWGTGHAVWCARSLLSDGCFAVINADDFYGADTFYALARSIERLSKLIAGANPISGAMVAYSLKDTLSEHGSVSRGICRIEGDRLVSVEEWSGIERKEGRLIGRSPTGEERELSGSEVVSMNVWVFPPGAFALLEAELRGFLEELSQPSTEEFYLPFAVDQWIREGRAIFRITLSKCRWMGVTYRQDKPKVSKSIAEMIERGEYPESL